MVVFYAVFVIGLAVAWVTYAVTGNAPLAAQTGLMSWSSAMALFWTGVAVLSGLCFGEGIGTIPIAFVSGSLAGASWCGFVWIGGWAHVDASTVAKVSLACGLGTGVGMPVATLLIVAVWYAVRVHLLAGSASGIGHAKPKDGGCLAA